MATLEDRSAPQWHFFPAAWRHAGLLTSPFFSIWIHLILFVAAVIVADATAASATASAAASAAASASAVVVIVVVVADRRGGDLTMGKPLIIPALSFSVSILIQPLSFVDFSCQLIMVPFSFPQTSSTVSSPPVQSGPDPCVNYQHDIPQHITSRC